MRPDAPPIPSHAYTALLFAMKIASSQAELAVWGSENAAQIHKLDPAERERFTQEYKSYRWLLGTKGQGQVQ